jgi:hypothetical protein
LRGSQRDGRMDKFTVFADGLTSPTTFAFANGGIILNQARKRSLEHRR